MFNIESVSPKKFLQVWLWAIIIVGALAISPTIQQANELEVVFWRSKRFAIIYLFAFASLGGLWLLRSSFLNRITQKMDELGKKPFHSMIGFAFILFGFSLVWVMRLYIFGDILPQALPIFWVFLWASLLQTIGVKIIKPNIQWHVAFAIILLAQGFIYQTIGLFRIVSNDPFSIGYSEAGRFYYASLFFSESLYGIKLPLPFLHPSRYLLLSLPFLIDDSQLWMHRFWQSLLWFGLTLLASFYLVRRFNFGKWLTACVTAWAFLYFLQGAVYYHLQVCVFLIFAGVSIKHPARSLFFIILASLWAGISRVNWFPVPAMLAIAIYIFETPVNENGWKYWITPFVWGIIGVASATLSQFVYIQLSGNADATAFGSSFTSDLIWARLLPNETNPMGILPGIILVSLPIWIGIYQIVYGNIKFLHPLRWLALLGMLLVLFAGGAVVSTKIGGGGDLHNMDAYMVLLSVVIMYLAANQVSAENKTKPMWGRVSWSVVVSAILIPLWFAIPKIGFFHKYDENIAKQDIQEIENFVTETIQNGGEVLFITERQLISFDDMQDIPLISEYEQIELMEMAMSRNQVYLEQYYADLANHRFALIVAEKQKEFPKKGGSFLEEDIAWVTYAGAPILCYYEPIESIMSNNIYFFVPRSESVECKDPFVD
jgi:hypothetical protein